MSYMYVTMYISNGKIQCIYRILNNVLVGQLRVLINCSNFDLFPEDFIEYDTLKCIFHPRESAGFTQWISRF